MLAVQCVNWFVCKLSYESAVMQNENCTATWGTRQAVVLPTISLQLNFCTNQSTHHSVNTKKTTMEEEKVVYNNPKNKAKVQIKCFTKQVSHHYSK
jgi:hypothetical protein